jgi:hypothetical protein
VEEMDMISIIADSQEEAVTIQEAIIRWTGNSPAGRVEAMEDKDMVRTWVEDMVSNREDNSLDSMGAAMRTCYNCRQPGHLNDELSFQSKTAHLNQPQGQMLPMYQDMQGGGTITPSIRFQLRPIQAHLKCQQNNIMLTRRTRSPMNETPFMNWRHWSIISMMRDTLRIHFFCHMTVTNEECDETSNGESLESMEDDYNMHLEMMEEDGLVREQCD